MYNDTSLVVEGGSPLREPKGACDDAFRTRAGELVPQSVNQVAELFGLVPRWWNGQVRGWWHGPRLSENTAKYCDHPLGRRSGIAERRTEGLLQHRLTAEVVSKEADVPMAFGGRERPDLATAVVARDRDLQDGLVAVFGPGPSHEGLGSARQRSADGDRPVIKRHKPTTTRRNLAEGYHGCLVIDVRQSADLYRRIDGWAHGAMLGMTYAEDQWGAHGDLESLADRSAERSESRNAARER